MFNLTDYPARNPHDYRMDFPRFMWKLKVESKGAGANVYFQSFSREIKILGNPWYRPRFTNYEELCLSHNSLPGVTTIGRTLIKSTILLTAGDTATAPTRKWPSFSQLSVVVMTRGSLEMRANL